MNIFRYTVLDLLYSHPSLCRQVRPLSANLHWP